MHPPPEQIFLVNPEYFAEFDETLLYYTIFHWKRFEVQLATRAPSTHAYMTHFESHSEFTDQT